MEKSQKISSVLNCITNLEYNNRDRWPPNATYE